MTRRLPWSSAALLVVVVLASVIALVCALYLWTYSGPRFDVVIINDQPIGGALEKLVAFVVGTVSGALAIFAVARLCSRWSEGRDESDRDHEPQASERR